MNKTDNKRKKLQKKQKYIIVFVVVVVIVLLAGIIFNKFIHDPSSGSASGISDTADSGSGDRSADDGNGGGDSEEGGSADDDNGSSDSKANADEDIDPTSLTLVAVGDNLISSSILTTCRNDDGTVYDFSTVFADTKNEISAADIAVINQETIFGGSEYGYSGYPNFNTPDSMGDAVIAAGFDVVLHATNHARDAYVDGIYNCIDYWEKHQDILMVGLNKTEEEYNTVSTIESNGITLAILNYTYGLNGYTLPEDEYYLVDLINEEKILSDIKEAEEIADITIVFPHWGTEYTTTQTESQEELAMMMTEAGADLIIGTHPHVLEPIEWIESENGNKCLCYYSLGNFTSGQQMTETLLGGMAKLTIKKDSSGTYIDSAGIIPLVTHYIWGTTGRVIRTYKLSDYTSDLAAVHSIRDYDNTFSYERLTELAKEILGDWIIN